MTGIHHLYDSAAIGHILTGLEPMGLKELRKKGFEGTNPTLDDPRANLLSSALDGQEDVLRHSSTDGFPAPVAQALEEGQTLKEALLDFLRRRFGNLTLIKYEDVDVSLPFIKFGIDSMLDKFPSQMPKLTGSSSLTSP
ncbi:hypothetical protein BU23DRAFT_554606 [Bimuria novae-zelandiae CBS 107.79]|uniref:Uncharacterized protein n=1 Tax=Bimuria novae-zelandiae CBS 107.79 TaxID=1447943 RepID=A0A6A5V7J6_9PLEO|nr:hypothetical protein BU23DRAFT_554606 [Bimuria novae-zelandiae CBS 107.79]